MNKNFAIKVLKHFIDFLTFCYFGYAPIRSGNLSYCVLVKSGNDYFVDIEFDEKEGMEIVKEFFGNVYQEVFQLGEILVLDDQGREVAGKGRKPCKRGIGFEVFDSVEEAIKKAKEVMLEVM